MKRDLKQRQKEIKGYKKETAMRFSIHSLVASPAVKKDYLSSSRSALRIKLFCDWPGLLTNPPLSSDL